MKRPPFKRAAVPVGTISIAFSNQQVTAFRNATQRDRQEEVGQHIRQTAIAALIVERFADQKWTTFKVKGGDLVDPANVAAYFCLEESSLLFSEAATTTTDCSEVSGGNTNRRTVMMGSLVADKSYFITGDIDWELLKTAAATVDNGVEDENNDSSPSSTSIAQHLLEHVIPRTNKILFAYDPIVLGHVPPLDRTPEAPQRVGRSVDLLKAHRVFGYFTGLNTVAPHNATTTTSDESTGDNDAAAAAHAYLSQLRVPTRDATPAEIYAVHDEQSYKAFIEGGQPLTTVGPLADAKKIPTDVYCTASTTINTTKTSNDGTTTPTTTTTVINPSQKAVLASCGLAIDTLKRVALSSHKKGTTNTCRENGTDDDDGIDGAFCLIRPPGHHCGCKTPNGFCLVNNVMVAATALLAEDPTQRVAIVDCDVHHGEGTQSLVEGMGRENILFYSTHRCDEGKFFPYGTGRHTNFGGNSANTADGEGEAEQQKKLEVEKPPPTTAAAPPASAALPKKSGGGSRGFGCCGNADDVATDNFQQQRPQSSSASHPATPPAENHVANPTASNASSSLPQPLPLLRQQCINVPFDTAAHIADECHKVMSDLAFIRSCDEVLIPALRLFKPTVVVLSCGFDSLFGDPLGRMAVTPNGYRALVKKIQNEGFGRRSRCEVEDEDKKNKKKKPFRPTRIVAVLEGGYNSEAVSHGVAAVYGTLLLNRHTKPNDETSSSCPSDGHDDDDGFEAQQMAIIDPLQRQGSGGGGSAATPFPASAVVGVTGGGGGGPSPSSIPPPIIPQTWAVLRSKQERALRDYRKIMAERAAEEEEEKKRSKPPQSVTTTDPSAIPPAADDTAKTDGGDAIVKKALVEPHLVPADDVLIPLHLRWVEEMIGRVKAAHPFLNAPSQ